MKSLKVLATIILALLLVSCEESENILVNVSKNDLVGTWNLTKLSQEGTISVEGVPVPAQVTSEGSNFDSVIEITDNPSNFSAKGSFVITTTIDNPLDDDIVNEEAIDLDEFFANGSWSVSDGVITVSQASVDQNIDILEFDGTTLKLQFEIEIPVDYNGLSLISNSTVDMTLVK